MAGTSSKGIVSIGLFVKQRFSRPLNSRKSNSSQSNLQISFPSKFSAAFFVSFWSAETGTEWNLFFAKLNSFVLKKFVSFWNQGRKYTCEFARWNLWLFAIANRRNNSRWNQKRRFFEPDKFFLRLEFGLLRSWMEKPSIFDFCSQSWKTLIFVKF